MTHKPDQSPKLLSAAELLRTAFDDMLADSGRFDQEVVQIARRHLGSTPARSKAGSNLAEDLVALAETRSAGGKS